MGSGIKKFKKYKGRGFGKKIYDKLSSFPNEIF
jgi:hypothetical protein